MEDKNEMMVSKNESLYAKPIRIANGFLPKYLCRCCKSIVAYVPIETIFDRETRKKLTEQFGKCKRCGSGVDWYGTFE